MLVFDCMALEAGSLCRPMPPSSEILMCFEDGIVSSKKHSVRIPPRDKRAETSIYGRNSGKIHDDVDSIAHHYPKSM